MTLEIDHTPDHIACVTLWPVPELPGVWSSRELEERVRAVVVEPETRALIVDAHQVDFAGTALISLLVELHIKAHRRGKGCFLCSVPPFVRDVIEKCRLDRVFAICRDRDEALEKARRNLDA